MRAAHEDAVGNRGDRAGKAINDEGDVMLRLQPEPCLRIAGVRLVAAGAINKVELESMAAAVPLRADALALSATISLTLEKNATQMPAISRRLTLEKVTETPWLLPWVAAVPRQSRSGRWERGVRGRAAVSSTISIANPGHPTGPSSYQGGKGTSEERVRAESAPMQQV